MIGFKGTKGPWFIGTGDPNGIELFAHRVQSDNIDNWDICAVWDDIPNSESNALLISKAPEMLEMLERVVALEDIICMGGAVGEQWVGEAQALEEMMDKIKQLIKSATEL